MQRMGHQGFASAGFPLNQHMTIRLPQIQNILAQPLHDPVGTNELLHNGAARRQLTAQLPIVQHQTPRPCRLLGQIGHRVGIKGFF